MRPYSLREQIGTLEGRVIHLLQEMGTQLLFIDEVHHLLAGTPARTAPARSICSSS